MIATAHVTAGMIAGVAALSVRGSGWRVAIALGLGTLSHVILDMIPHSDYGKLSQQAILAIVALELSVTFTFGWWLLRRRQLPGLRLTLPPALAGAMLPDMKFFGNWLPDPIGSFVKTAGYRFHEGWHTAPTPLAVGLSAELACTVLLITGLLLIVRRYPRKPIRRA